jgi:hypothetical protein
VSTSPSMTRTGRTRLARVGLLILALAAMTAFGLLASACGGSSGEGVARVDPTSTKTRTTDSGSPDRSSSADPTAYSACMRKHGVAKFPDPDSEGVLRLKAGPGTGIDPESAQFKAADTACRKLGLGPPTLSLAQQAEERERLVEYAACMRKHGLPKFPDPKPDGGLVLKRGGDIDPNSAQFKEAQKACEDLLPGAGAGFGSTENSGGGTP